MDQSARAAIELSLTKPVQQTIVTCVQFLEKCAIQWLCVSAHFWGLTDMLCKCTNVQMCLGTKLSTGSYFVQSFNNCNSGFHQVFLSQMSCAQFCAAEESCAGGQVVAVAVAGGQVHMSCCSSCATWAVHSFVLHTMLTQRLYPPPPSPPSSLHPLSANSSPHITSSSSGLPPQPPYLSLGIFHINLCLTLLDPINALVSSSLILHLVIPWAHTCLELQ